MGKQNTGGIYAGMTFPPYVFVEFPKWVTNKQGERVIVHSAREELALASEPDPQSVEAVPPIVEERDKLAAALAEAQAEIQALRLANSAQAAAVTKATEAPKGPPKLSLKG